LYLKFSNKHNFLIKIFFSFFNFTLKSFKKKGYIYSATTGYVAPASLDWVSKGFNKPVLNQMCCGWVNRKNDFNLILYFITFVCVLDLVGLLQLPLVWKLACTLIIKQV
jgi:hypothetical protein